MFTSNKITALIIILVLLIVCYIWTSRRKATKNNPKKKGGRVSKNTRKSKKTRAVTKKKDENEEDENEEEDAIQKDAEELYNTVHESLCNGMQQEEFEELAGDLADNFTFIELKQLYNQCIQKKMDPSTTITVDDYVAILRKGAN